jgi:flagellin-like hook-associated protein FlgL
VTKLAQESILNQTGIAALSQANQQTQALLALFR